MTDAIKFLMSWAHLPFRRLYKSTHAPKDIIIKTLHFKMVDVLDIIAPWRAALGLNLNVSPSEKNINTTKVWLSSRQMCESCWFNEGFSWNWIQVQNLVRKKHTLVGKSCENFVVGRFKKKIATRRGGHIINFVLLFSPSCQLSSYLSPQQLAEQPRVLVWVKSFTVPTLRWKKCAFI